MSPPHSNEPLSSGGGSRQFWLFLLLIVLIVALVVYDHGAVRHYGQQAISKAEKATKKASSWAKNLYTCGIPGCGPKSGNAPTPPMQTVPDKVAVADPNAAPTTPNAVTPTTNTEPAAGTADTQAAPPENTASEQPQTSGVVNYPAYPPYPAYPNYPPDASFGARGFGGDSAPAGAPVGDTAPSAPPPAPAVASSQPALPYLPPSAPPRPPKPEAAPGKPEYPDYPAYPQSPSAATPPMMPAPGMAPPSRAPRPDQQRAAPLASEAIGIDGLAQARRSAQAGRMNESVREYLLYLTSQTNDVDAYGELGNVYMKMGRYPEAAQNYYEAATRLIDAGYLNAVASLMPVIQMHEPMLATLLNKKIANATGGNQGNRR